MTAGAAGAADSSKGAGGAGLVVAAHGRRGLLDPGDGSRLPYQVRGRRLRVVCGDRVRFGQPAAGVAVVEAVLPRDNELQRVAGRGEAETLAANLGKLVVVLSPAPEPDLWLADRYLCAARLMGAAAALAWNKADAADRPPAGVAAFAALGYPVFVTSARTGAGVAALRAWLGDSTGILLGQSGVGKSSLLNALVPGATVATGEISRATDEGRHTTTASVLHPLPGGGFLADTPGVRDFVPVVAERRDIGRGFVEIAEAARGCRFGDCSHLREDHCAVQAAVAAGRIDPRRYESYRRLMNLNRQAAARDY